MGTFRERERGRKWSHHGDRSARIRAYVDVKLTNKVIRRSRDLGVYSADISATQITKVG